MVKYRGWCPACVRMTGLLIMLLILVLTAFPVSAQEEKTEEEWINFFLMCNEGMNNRGGNSGNTMMVAAMNQHTGAIRLMTLTWDTFVKYEGYDLPQKLEMAYRNNGPEEAVKVFNENFDIDVELYMSLNFLNLASLIDSYGGVTVEVTRPERNALNAMVISKKENIQAMEDSNLLEQIIVEMLAKEYYLNEFGPETHLNGLQAVAFGWLQYDSVYNCCERELEVIASLFKGVGHTINEEVILYTDEDDVPVTDDSRRPINLDHVTEEDIVFLQEAVGPIFEMSYHNLEEEQILGITLTIARVSYLAAKQGVNILDQIETAIFPLEVLRPYDMVAGAKGHLVDYEANSAAMRKFLYNTP